MIKLTPEATRSIKAFLQENGVEAPVRVDLHGTGCCDASLGLCIDTRRTEDLVHESDGISLIIAPQIFQTVGDVTIDYADEPDKRGFVITSRKPLSEWDGFGVCDIRMK